MRPSALSLNLQCPSIDALLQLCALFILAFCTAGAGYAAQVLLSPTYEPFPDDRLAPASLNNFIELEYSVALRGVLQNIGPGGVNADGAAPGVVVASPSKTNPNCK